MSRRPPDAGVLDVAITAARAAGAVALRYFREGFEVGLKPDRTPVTEADREGERVIRDVVTKAFPDHGFLGEEYGAEGPSEVRWIIDPVDGTKNFVRHIPIWAVLIAFEEYGAVTAGVMFNPVTDELFAAARGAGASRNGRPVRVSEVAELSRAFLVHAGLGLVRQAGYWDGFLRLIDATDRQRGFGDYYGYGLVAAGQAEIYAEVDLKPWDLAPAKVIVEEAGGRFTDLAGRSTIYTGTAVATNGRLHDRVLALLAGGQRPLRGPHAS
jgi:histidinol-phosphatase